jgi:VWFA-related protein
MLNEVRFEQYHMFRAESRVLTAEDSASGDATPESAKPNPISSERPLVENEPMTAIEPRSEAPVAGNNEENAGTSLPVSEPEISISNSAAVPDALPASPVHSSGFRMRTTSKLVDISVVAYDQKGHPVTNLKLSDFAIYDNGRRQDIKYFGQAGQSASSPSPASEQSPEATAKPVFSNRQIGPAMGQPAAQQEQHASILMIDASNLAWNDLSYARQDILRFLKTVPADEPAGLYILRSYGFEILLEPTSNHSLVAAELSQWMPTAQDLSRAQDEEQRNRQNFDWVHSAADLERVNGNGGRSPETFDNNKNQLSPTLSATSPVDPRLREMGSNPERDSLVWLVGVGRHLASVPGRKNLIWVSSDNVLADWSDNVSRSEKTTKFLDSLAIQVGETMNEARVSLYPLDASELEPGGVSADRGTRNVLAVGKSDREFALAGLGDAFPGNRNGRDAAKLQQDLHSIQGTFRDLAQATGGRALRRAGDIATELTSIAGDGRAAYLMSFTPDLPADDKYHLITVKLAGRANLTLRYRTGYLYEKEPATLRQRFQQAVWRARDVNDIALTATPAGSGKNARLKLNIAATDLAIAEGGGRWTDKLDIFLIERDDAVLHAKLNGRTLTMKLQPATYQKALGDGIVLEEELPLRVSGSLRVVVVDENSGRMGSLTLPRSTP